MRPTDALIVSVVDPLIRSRAQCTSTLLYTKLSIRRARLPLPHVDADQRRACRSDVHPPERIEHVAYFARFDAYFVRFGAYFGLLRLFRYEHTPVAQRSVKDITLIHNSSKNTEKTAYC